jgi:hypothetical protein
MKFLLLFCGTPEYSAMFEAMTEDQRKEGLATVNAWIEEHHGKIGGRGRLMPAETATTVRFGWDGPPVVTDGPFMEGKEAIGGYAEIDVADLDEALRMAKSWPARGTVEIRPVREQP